MNRLSGIVLLRGPNLSLPWTFHSVLAKYSTKPDYAENRLQQIIETSSVGISQKIENERKEVERKDRERKEQKKTIPPKANFASADTSLPKSKSGEIAPKLDLERAQQVIADGKAQITKAISTGAEKKQKEWAEKFKAALSDMRSTLSVATSTLNQVTGYSSIEKLKMSVEKQEKELQEARTAVKAAKHAYAEAIQRRSELQKEVNELLTRKHLWTAQDVERFTELYRSDHQNQQDENDAERKLEETEQMAEGVQVKLTTLILTRYHEEQIWSDKIRQVLTWGTWMLMGVNILLFATATFFVEPWKRKKLVHAFHEEVQGKLDGYTEEIQRLSGLLTNASTTSEKQEIESSILDVTLQESGVLPKGSHINHESRKFELTSWSKFFTWAKLWTEDVRNPSTRALLVEKPELAFVSCVLVASGWCLGSLITFLVSSYR